LRSSSAPFSLSRSRCPEVPALGKAIRLGEERVGAHRKIGELTARSDELTTELLRGPDHAPAKALLARPRSARVSIAALAATLSADG
jgi:hypothetical protein